MDEENLSVADRLIEDVTGLWRLVRAASYPGHAGHHLTPQQFWLLRFLERQCPVSVGHLADALGITSSSATSAAKRLEQDGLVTRTRQIADERVVEVNLTAQGRAQLVAMRQRQRDAMGRLLAVLEPREQATLHQLLARVLAAGGQHAASHPYCPAGRHTLEEARAGGEPSALSSPAAGHTLIDPSGSHSVHGNTLYSSYSSTNGELRGDDGG